MSNTAATSLTGIQGNTGAQGDKGGLRYFFDSSTAAGVSTNGSLRFDNATIGSVANLYINVLDVLGNNFASYIAQWAASTNTIKGYIVIAENLNSGTPFAVFSVTAVANHSTYYTISVANVVGTLPVNGDQLAVTWLRVGDAGSSAATWPLTSLTDPLTSFNTALWCQQSMSPTPYAQQGTVSVSGGSATITPQASAAAYTGMTTVAPYDLRGRSFVVKVTPGGGGAQVDTYIYAAEDRRNNVAIVQENGTLYFQRLLDGSNSTLGSTSYNSTSHKYWRLREAASVIYYETSPDNVTWTTQQTLTYSTVLTSDVRLVMAAGTYSGVGSPTAAVFSYVNFA